MQTNNSLNKLVQHSITNVEIGGKVRTCWSSKLLLATAIGICIMSSYTYVYAAPLDVTTRVTSSNTASTPYHSITYSTDGNGYGAVQPDTGTLNLYLTNDSSINTTAYGGSAAASGLRLRYANTNIDVMSGNLNIFVYTPTIPTNNDVFMYGIFTDRSGTGHITVGSGSIVNTAVTVNGEAATGYSTTTAGVQNATNDQTITFNGNINMDISAQSSKNTVAIGVNNTNAATNAIVNMTAGSGDIKLSAITKNTPTAAAYAQAYAFSNFGLNQTITTGNNMDVAAIADARAGGASAETMVAINSSNAGNSAISMGSDINITLDAYGGTAVTRASIARNHGDVNNIDSSRNISITMGDRVTATVNAESTTASTTLASAAFNRDDTHSARISFGSAAVIDLTAKSKDGLANTVVADNASSTDGGNIISFANSNLLKAKAISTGSGDATVYGAFNRGNDNDITFGDTTTLQLTAHAQGTGQISEANGAMNTYGSNLSKISFGNNTSFDLQTKGGLGSALIYALGNMGSAASTNMSQSITLGNNTTIVASSVSDARANQVYGAFNRLDSFNSQITFGNNTTMNLSANGTGVIEAIGMYSGSRDSGDNTIIAGSQTTITATVNATGAYAPDVDSAVALGIRTEGAKNTVTLGDAAVMNITATATGGNVKARGIQTRDADQEIDVQGGAIITTRAVSDLGTNSSAYAIYSTAGTRDSSNIRVNVDSNGNSYGKTVQLIGDVVAAGSGNVYVSLPTTASFLKGTVLQYDSGKLYMTLDNSAKWELAINSYDAAGVPVLTLPDNSIRVHNLQLGSDTLIDITADNRERLNNWRTLSFSGAQTSGLTNSAFAINGSGNTFVLNSDIATNNADKIVISSLASGTNYIKINNDSTYAKGGKETSATKTLVVQTIGGRNNFLGSFAGTRSDRGIYSWTPNVQWDAVDNNWYIIGNSKTYSQTVHAAIAYMRLPNSTMLKRMGELRDNKAYTGLWLRIYAGESNLYSGAGNQTHSAIQGGMDKVSYRKDRRIFTGLMLESLTASSSWQDGSRGRSSMFDIGIYQSNVYNDGRYYDLMGRFYNLNHHLTTIDSEQISINGQYRNWALEGSIEYGQRKELGRGYFWIPQAQLTYKYIKGANYVTDNAINFQQKDVSSLIGRLGLVVGKKYKDNSQLYLETSILREFMASTNVRISDNYGQTSHIGLSDKETWLSLALGYTKKISTKSDVYFELERTFGSRNDLKWQGKIGARWSW